MTRIEGRQESQTWTAFLIVGEHKYQNVCSRVKTHEKSLEEDRRIDGANHVTMFDSQFRIRKMPRTI